MSRVFSSGRIAAAALSLFAAVVIYWAIADGRQRAQDDAGDSTSAKYASADLVTADIRSESKQLSRVRISGPNDRAAAAHYGRIVADYGSFVIIAKDKGSDLRHSGLESQLIDTTIHLPGADFDPITNAPPASLDANRNADGKGYYILQFGGTASDEWLESVRRAGVEILQYVPHQAYFVYADAEAVAKVSAHSRVRWIGAYSAGQKLSANLREQIAAVRNNAAPRKGLSAIKPTPSGKAVFDVAVFARADVDAAARQLQSSFSSTARISRLPNNFFNIIRVELRPEEVEAAAALPDVFSVEPFIKPEREDERSSQILAGNYSHPTAIAGPGYNPRTQFGVDGFNVTVSVVDDGVAIPGDGGYYITNSNAVNGPLRGAAAGAVGHGHLNATIIAGAEPFSILDNGGYNYGLGVAPKANIINIPLLRFGYTGTDADVFNDSVSQPGPNGTHANISNNSWGAGTNGNSYTSYAAQYDGFVRDASFDGSIDPICIVFSAGNSGANGLGQPKVAKNLISVANSESLRTELAGLAANNIDDINSTSSRGPAADGRIKPDISAPGSGISGGRSGIDALFGNIDANHRWSSGTSHAAPQIAGAAALFTNYWKLTHANDIPSPALIKAAIINTAQEMNGNLSSAPVPNGNEGWGRANLKSMLNTGVGMKYIDEEIELNNTGAAQGFSGTIGDSSKPVRVTLVWTDPPGVADPALVNNLDLTVTIGNNVYKGNVFSNGVSIPGGAADTLNNVENVFLPAGIPAGTAFTVSVRATALNGDGVLGNLDFTDQNYAVAAYNYSSLPAASFHTVAGRVLSPSGRGVSGARIRITDNEGRTKERLTNHFGYYYFPEIAGGGQVYTLTVSSKRHTFGQQNLVVSGNLADINITAISGSP